MIFRVKIAGQGFAMIVDGALGRYGFFTNCFVSAANATEASKKALEEVADRCSLAAQSESTEGPSAKTEKEPRGGS